MAFQALDHLLGNRNRPGKPLDSLVPVALLPG
jgi:hypothetical protein